MGRSFNNPAGNSPDIFHSMVSGSRGLISSGLGRETQWMFVHLLMPRSNYKCGGVDFFFFFKRTDK